MRSLSQPMIRWFRSASSRVRWSGGSTAKAKGEYWLDAGRPDWKTNSHWRDSPVAGWSRTWDEIGVRHVEAYHRFARAYSLGPPQRVMEWGVGGGANAIRFAPLGREFIAVDVSQKSLDETVRQVRAACNKPATPILVSLKDQTGPVAHLGQSIDLFICYYVLELVPSEKHAHQIVETAFRMLRPGGAAIIQAKYRSSAPRFWRRSDFATRLANSYIVGIADFWQFLSSLGFRVCQVELVPQDRLDRNYAYYYMMRPT